MPIALNEDIAGRLDEVERILVEVGHYYDGRDGEQRSTVITSEFGRLKGRRIVRGSEEECEALYQRQGPTSPAPPAMNA